MFDILLRPAVWAPAVLLVGYVLYQLFGPSGLPKLPIVGAREGDWFPLWQATWRNTKDFKGAVKEAYRLYRDQACILPEAGNGNLIVLPVAETQFIVDQPDSVLDMHGQVMEGLQTDYTILDPKLLRTPVHLKIITTTLTNQIGNLVPDVSEETEWGFAKYWGTDTAEFRDVCVYDTMRRLIGNITNRVFVGLPSCRDTALLDAGMAYAQDVPLSSMLLKLVPRVVRPLVAPLITVPNRIHTHAFTRALRREIEKRLAQYDARVADPESKSSPEPNDFLQWTLKQAKESGDPYMWQVETLAGRVLLLNFAAIHTSSFAITNAILDLISSSPEAIDELREEVSSVLGQHDGQWNKRGLAQMEKLDSVLRESARLNSFTTVGLMRLVVPKEGMTTPSGVHLPRGSRLVAQSYPVLHDDDIYPDAETFQPFRFSERRSDVNTEYVKRARNAFATTSTDYLAFGHGKFACPGRFFAANELKLMLGHLVLHYDFEMQETRPRNQWFGLIRVPPMQATIRIRRREESG